MPENSQYLVKHINPQVEKVEWTPNKIKLKTTPKYIIIKLLKPKDKEKFLKAEKNDTLLTEEHQFKW